MPISTRPADAVLVPEALKRGARRYLRLNSIMAIAEPLMGVRFERGEKGYMRRTMLVVDHPTQPGSKTNLLFITKNPHDTMLFPVGHPRHPEPRYRWEKDGLIQLGYLIVSPEEEIGIYGSIPRPA